MVLILYSNSVYSKAMAMHYYDSTYTIFQGGLGGSFTNLQYGQMFGLNGNLTFFRYQSPFFAGVDANYLLAFNHYEWPGIGNYQYNRSITCLSPLLGATLYNTNKFSFAGKFKANFVNFNGALKTNHPLLKEYIIPSYKGQHFGFSFSAHAAYRISPKIVAQVDLGYFRIAKQTTYIYYNFGLAYNLISTFDK